ncbi:sn-glycerol-3-phosphate ABC transporter ATP-binding protein UgpC [Chelativorans sp. AA-79]|uniref:ABC transporter ATP-binding protein n=1 Tax=Chelativorans sp. AA-79 TaxID=3028735 RepID=UPI0023F73ACB|nr:sn-glycerol-3-phosphate ABC transporter ATP-binding protein UgpC [Chelativorans sp. AA-79]WEX08041.1 sn-glycerol-3-phosphate ABC transporter ATP-binding protein UgpC [Chelativorans sp. AA-79]
MRMAQASRAAGISLAGLTKSYDGTVVIPELSAEMAGGEFTVILGPSGCGKSTLLNMIAGLEPVSGGTIRFGEREVQDLEPKHRGCAMVFQNYALYPHMSVFRNIAYSLKVAGLSEVEQSERVGRVAKMLGLTDLLDRKPSQLSGGQRQRVAIGRAIVREPSVLLFDEPLSNLDAQLRHDMRIELAELHRRIGATTVFVTHDQVEAMTLADRILVLNKGRIEQFDTPREIYHRPASEFVARFIGAPPMNILSVTGNGTGLRVPDGPLLVPSSRRGDFRLGIRPEDVTLGARLPDGIPVTLVHREDLGSHNVVTVRLDGGAELRVTLPFGSDLDESRHLFIVLPRHRLHLFEPGSGRAIRNAFEDIGARKEEHV